MSVNKIFLETDGLVVGSTQLVTSGGAVYVGNTLVVDGNLYSRAIVANGSIGSAGFVLTSNGTSTYWAAPISASNTVGFANGQSIQVANLIISAQVTANNSTGRPFDVLTSSAVGVYWGPPVGYTGSLGFTGIAGYTGSAGIGYNGSQGDPGYTGSQGPQGVGYSGSAGFTGSMGYIGSTGYGVPPGGLANQVLVKNSGNDYDTYWSTVPGANATVTLVATVYSPGALITGNNNYISRWYPARNITINKVRAWVISPGFSNTVISIRKNDVEQYPMTINGTVITESNVGFNMNANDYLTVIVTDTGSIARDLYVSFLYG